MSSLISFFGAHQVLTTLASYWVLSAMVGSLPAPTAQSSSGYVFFFKFFNSIAGNIIRAIENKVESSPNFQPALNLQQKIAGQQQTTVKVPPTVEDQPKP